ncbi:hypothetical protein EZV62_002086 [Acer yangbiense]|uniref:Uncharacterized protein n=1 Tax=Acer yangbiense TaxID=1000413 RepID=A0A5C7IW15_9ROSI|nr:hypothetical protein EZV62_002086 [Acer yangbiense]
MRRQGQYADPGANSYGAGRMQHMSSQRMEQKSGHFQGQLEAFTPEREHPYATTKTDRQWRWERDGSKVPNPESSQMFNEGMGGVDASRSYFQGQRPDPKLASEKQNNNDPRSRPHKEDMDVGYEDKPLSNTFEDLEQKFLDDIMKLLKEQNDAEDAENARHRECSLIEWWVNFQSILAFINLEIVAANEMKKKTGSGKKKVVLKEIFKNVGVDIFGFQETKRSKIDERVVTSIWGVSVFSELEGVISKYQTKGLGKIGFGRNPILDTTPMIWKVNAINARYEEQLVALRARHGSHRDEFLRKESQARQQHYQKAMMDHYPNSGAGPGDCPGDPHGYSGPAAAPAVGEGYRAYNSDHYDSYRERARFLGGPRDHGFEPRGQYPGGRVYDTGSRYY